MKYWLIGDTNKELYIEEEDKIFRFDKKTGKWISAGTELFDARFGYDDFEEENSPYRWGSESCRPTIIEISKEEAEKFIGKRIIVKEIAVDR